MIQKTFKTVLFYSCLLIVLSCNVSAQNKNTITVDAGFLQLKDAFNYGLVFSGVQVGVQYQRHWTFPKTEIRYNPEFALGIPFSKGMIAINLHLVPVNVSIVTPVYKQNTHSLKIGGNVMTNYNWQVYPDLQGGHLFWFSEIGLSPVVEYAYQWKQHKINILLQNSVLGFVSHTEKNEPYFYSFKFSDFIVRPNSNLKFGSFDKYNHTKFVFEFVPNMAKKHAFAVGMEYMGIWDNVHFQSLNYYLQWKKPF